MVDGHEHIAVTFATRDSELAARFALARYGSSCRPAWLRANRSTAAPADVDGRITGQGNPVQRRRCSPKSSATQCWVARLSHTATSPGFQFQRMVFCGIVIRLCRSSSKTFDWCRPVHGILVKTSQPAARAHQSLDARAQPDARLEGHVPRCRVAPTDPQRIAGVARGAAHRRLRWTPIASIHPMAADNRPQDGRFRDVWQNVPQCAG